jgi:hypothetical protein
MLICDLVGNVCQTHIMGDDPAVYLALPALRVHQDVSKQGSRWQRAVAAHPELAARVSLDSYCTVAMPGVHRVPAPVRDGRRTVGAYLGHGPADNEGHQLHQRKLHRLRVILCRKGGEPDPMRGTWPLLAEPRRLRPFTFRGGAVVLQRRRQLPTAQERTPGRKHCMDCRGCDWH